jgi:salicylate hydroxylase
VHRIIYDLAISAGAKIDFGTTVTTVSPGEPNPSVTLDSGETIIAHVVIGADGPQSIVRKVVVEDEEDLHPEGHTLLMGLVPEEYMMQHSELAEYMEAAQVSLILFILYALCYDCSSACLAVHRSWKQ